MPERPVDRWIEVATLDDLWEGDFLDVEVEGETVLLVHLPGGTIKAYQGICPHQEIALADGDFDFESGILTCSAHQWQFELATGQGVNPSDCRLYEYPVKVEDEKIFIGWIEGERHYNRCAG